MRSVGTDRASHPSRAAVGGASLRAIAAAAELSLATVSNILGGRYKGNTPKGRRRVAAVTSLARRSGYVANASARRLREGRHQAFLVLLPVDEFGMPTAFAYEYLMGVAQALQEPRVGLIVQPHPRVAEASLPRERACDAAVVLDVATPAIARWLAELALPAAFINVAPARGRATFNRDEEAAGADLIAALARRGYRRALVVGTTDAAEHFSYAERARGIARAAAELGVELDRIDLRWWSGLIPRELAKRRIAAGTVLVAMDAHAALILQRHAPRGAPLACCDAPHLFREVMPDLTRAVFDRQALGRRAAEWLLARLDRPRARVETAPARFGVTVGATTPALTLRPRATL